MGFSKAQQPLRTITESLYLWKGGRKRRLWGLFSTPLSLTPQPAVWPLELFLGSRAPSAQRASNADCCSRFRHPLSLTLPPPFLRGAYFGSTSSVPKMNLSPFTLHIMARGIYRTVLPTGLRPRLPIPSSPSKLRRLLSFQRDARFKS
jgi:hypothetical protein